jgi:predicted HTH transcriptional regulator
VQTLVLEGSTVLAVHIPQAPRKLRPVYLNGQPLGHTWRRLHDGDRLCDVETVKRMLAEQLEDSRDTRLLPRFGLQDLDPESLRAYRQMFAVVRPDHPWNAPDDISFLKLMGGWRDDRDTSDSGLTLAGLLMFGQWPSISEAAPLYFVDYQEQTDDADATTRWLDRLVPDGTWSGNLFDFYRRVIRKLGADLKVPFVLKGDTRIDDTPVHQALREALVNTLVHADYNDRASVRVVKRPSGFEFRNPGALRIPARQALHGGLSDCRNRTIQQMFLMLNLGERAGSGLPRILAGWEGQGRSLVLRDDFEPHDHTVLTMSWGPSTTQQGRPGATGTPGKTPGEMPGKTPGKTPGKAPGKTPELVLQALLASPSATVPALALQLGRSESAILRAIRKLREEGRLRRIGPDKGGHWAVLG